VPTPKPASTRQVLTPRQVEIVLRGIASGETRDEVAASAGITPYVLTQRLRDQLGGIRLKAGRPKGDEAWIEPTGDEELASASSLALAPWVAARAAALRETWTEERWARAIGKRLPYEVEVLGQSDRDFTDLRGPE
jgi:hypothetical protein